MRKEHFEKVQKPRPTQYRFQESHQSIYKTDMLTRDSSRLISELVPGLAEDPRGIQIANIGRSLHVDTLVDDISTDPSSTLYVVKKFSPPYGLVSLLLQQVDVKLYNSLL